jgi:maltooligosyltrehalose trehalohydrolase
VIKARPKDIANIGARRYPVGAELIGESEASIRIWAPDHSAVDVVVDGIAQTLEAEPGGYFSAQVDAGAGSRYGFRFAGDVRVYPDPASRGQPDGPDALSAIVNLSSYRWSDAGWKGVSLPGQVLYELHVGTFTAEGTWRAAEAHLPGLRDLGVTVIQMMPVGEFAGAFGWGYDGVQWFAPMHTYGAPADLQRFIDAAHQAGLGVILDVVYNHVGPSGNHLARFATGYFTRRHSNEWGEALNFDGRRASGMRELVLSNVEYWVREFHVDGFRLDAVQQIFDDSSEDVVTAIARVAREAAGPRAVIVIGEHEPQDAALMRSPEQGGRGLDGIFNEDFHHSARVALTGIREAYLSDYHGVAREWLAAARAGFLFQGQFYSWQSAPRGTPALDRPAHQFINFLENHDQVANSPSSRRLIDLTSPAWWRAMSALLLIGPWTPLLFQGQEWGSRRPFRYFADHAPELQSAVVTGRREFVSQFPRTASLPLDRLSIDRGAFNESGLDHPDVETSLEWRLYRDLLTLRRDDPSLGQHARRLEGAALRDQTLILRFFGEDPTTDRLAAINLGPDVNLATVGEPLVAAPAGASWSVLWCSEDVRYGGGGVAACAPPAVLMAAGHAATIFQTVARS